MEQGRPAKIFVSYAHEDAAYLSQIRAHLKLLERSGMFSMWTDHEIGAGDEWREGIHEELMEADIILLLVSSDALNSDFIWDVELTEALRRHEDGTALVIPVIIRACVWDQAPFAKLQVLPKGGRPVEQWPDADDAWRSVVEGLRKSHLRWQTEQQRSASSRRPGGGASKLRTRSLMAASLVVPGILAASYWGLAPYLPIPFNASTPAWACLGKGPGEVSRRAEPFSLGLEFVDLISKKTPGSVGAKLCTRLDIACQFPLRGARGDGGYISLHLDAPWEGHVFVESSEKLPGIVAFAGPVVSETKIRIPLVGRAGLHALVSAVGATFEPDSGQVIVVVKDCQGRPARGLVLAHDASDASSVIYLVKDVPSRIAQSTTGSGQAVLLNVQPGIVSLSPRLPDGRSISTTPVPVRGGHITYITLVPE